jgi:hypothetical protein
MNKKAGDSVQNLPLFYMEETLVTYLSCLSFTYMHKASNKKWTWNICNYYLEYRCTHHYGINHSLFCGYLPF